MRLTNFAWTLMCTAAILATGCAGGNTGPAAPTATTLTADAPAAPVPPTGGATIAGTVSSGASTATLDSAHAFNMPGVIISVVGTGISGTADVTGSFTLSNVPDIDVVLAFSGPGVDATLPLGSVAAADQLLITVTLSGGSATLNTLHRQGTDQSVEVEGLIDSVDPSRQLTVNGAAIYVPTDATVRHGGTDIPFSDLRRGDRVHIHGVTNGTTIVASKVLVQNTAPAPPPAPTDPAPEPVRVTFSGMVVQLTGSCPSLQLKIGSTKVKTNSSTAFTGKACADIKLSDTASGSGFTQSEGMILSSDGMILADGLQSANPSPVTFSGWVTQVTGSCPSLTIKIGGTKVATNAATTFTGKACADIKYGDTASGSGLPQYDGTVLGASVQSATPSPVSFSGTVIQVTGSCPSLTIKVGSTKVTTNGATTFTGKACADVKYGDTASGSGLPQPEGTVLAASVQSASPPPVTFSGTVISVTGSCPSLTIKVGSTKVTTSGATTFTGKSCGDIKVGDTASGNGIPQPEGIVLADNVQSASPPPVTFSGGVTLLTGSCPYVEMKVGGTKIKTSSATTFTGRSCGDIKNGDMASGSGLPQSDGYVLANSVQSTAAPTP